MNNVMIRYSFLGITIGILTAVALLMFSSASAQTPTTAAQGEDETADFMFEADAENEVVVLDEDWVDWDSIAAEALGMSVDDLWAAYEDGRSLKDLAAEKGIDPQTIIDVLVEAETAFINRLVADGEIDGEEAEMWLADVEQYVTEYVELSGMYTDYVDWDEVIVETLGITMDELYEAYGSGQSIADLATSREVDPQVLIDTLVDAEKAMISDWVEQGDFTAEEAEEWLADIETYVTDFIMMTGDDMMFFDDEYVSWESIAGDLLGMSEDEIWQAFDEGRTIADLAEEKGVALQGIVDALVTAEAEFIASLVEDGAISQEEGDEWLAEVSNYVTEYVSNSYSGMGMVEGDWVSWEAVAAELIGVTEADIWAGYEDGKSLADLAAEANIDVQQLIDAIVTAETEFIQNLVSEGEIDQEEADEWIAELAQIVSDFVNDDVMFEIIDVEPAE